MAFEKSDRSSRPMHRGRKKVCSFCVDRVDTITRTVPVCVSMLASALRSFPAVSPAPALSISVH